MRASEQAEKMRPQGEQNLSRRQLYSDRRSRFPELWLKELPVDVTQKSRRQTRDRLNFIIVSIEEEFIYRKGFYGEGAIPRSDDARG
jgi:hypothetical protein